MWETLWEEFRLLAILAFIGVEMTNEKEGSRTQITGNAASHISKGGTGFDIQMPAGMPVNIENNSATDIGGVGFKVHFTDPKPLQQFLAAVHPELSTLQPEQLNTLLRVIEMLREVPSTKKGIVATILEGLAAKVTSSLIAKALVGLASTLTIGGAL